MGWREREGEEEEEGGDDEARVFVGIVWIEIDLKSERFVGVDDGRRVLRIGTFGWRRDCGNLV